MSRIFLAILFAAAWLDAHAQSSLPPCPTDTSVVWTNCFGTKPRPDGRTYVGEFKDNKYEGQGTYTWPSGEKYVGEWKDDKANGQGTRTWPNGEKYVGEYKDGKRNGQGTMTWPSGEKYVGEWKDGKQNGQGTYTSPSGEKYVGEYKDGERNGQGTYTLPSGEKYVGEFKDDEPTGQGTYTWPSGEKYVGEWKDGKYEGQGTYTWPSGAKYVGEFRDGLRNGQGIQYNSDGSVKDSGMWSDDQLSQSFAINTVRFPFASSGEFGSGGSRMQRCPTDRSTAVWTNCFGTYSWPDGASYFGEFKDNKRHGQGTMTYPDGRVRSGRWESDKFLNPTPSETVKTECPDPPDWDLTVCWEKNPIRR